MANQQPNRKIITDMVSLFGWEAADNPPVDPQVLEDEVSRRYPNYATQPAVIRQLLLRRTVEDICKEPTFGGPDLEYRTSMGVDGKDPFSAAPSLTPMLQIEMRKAQTNELMKGVPVSGYCRKSGWGHQFVKGHRRRSMADADLPNPALGTLSGLVSLAHARK